MPQIVFSEVEKAAIEAMVAKLRQLVEEQDAVMPQCWGMSPEVGSLARPDP